MKARRLMNKGCRAYLAAIVEVPKMDTSLEQTSIVREYLNMLPDDLYNLLPEREIEFVIDHVPG